MVELLAEVVGALGDTGVVPGAVPLEVGTVGTTGSVPGALPVGMTGSVPGALPLGTAGVVELAGVEYGTLGLVGDKDEVDDSVLGLLEMETLREGGPQLKPTLWTPMLQGFWGVSLGSLNVTEVAPPHCVFLTSDPDFEQDTVCLQVSPLG